MNKLISDISEVRFYNKEELTKEEKLYYNSLLRFALQKAVSALFPDSKLSKCLREPLEHRNYVSVSRINVKNYFSGLIVCNNPWVCPICSRKISEWKKQELRLLIQKHVDRNGQLFMLTLTVPHSCNDNLLDLLGNFQKSYKKFTINDSFKRFMHEKGMLGWVRALEVTWGNVNGWHVHSHILFFLDGHQMDLSLIRYKLFSLWRSSVVSLGFDTPSLSGFDVRDANSIEDYLNKHFVLGFKDGLSEKEFRQLIIEKHKDGSLWGMEDEITKQVLKTGNYRSLTPFDLLKNYFFYNDKFCALLFKEFAHAFSCPYGDKVLNRNAGQCKGRSPLTYSKTSKLRLSLKKLYLDDGDDEDDGDELGVINVPISLYRISLEKWREILDQNSRGAFLNFCETSDFERVQEFLGEI